MAARQKLVIGEVRDPEDRLYEHCDGARTEDPAHRGDTAAV
jgi:hypothetical protein